MSEISTTSSPLAIEAANLLIKYNSIEDRIHVIEHYWESNISFVIGHLDLLSEDSDSLTGHAKESYDRLIEIYKDLRLMLNDLHNVSKSLYDAGIRGDLLSKARDEGVNCLLERRVQSKHKEEIQSRIDACNKRSKDLHSRMVLRSMLT